MLTSAALCQPHASPSSGPTSDPQDHQAPSYAPHCRCRALQPHLPPAEARVGGTRAAVPLRTARRDEGAAAKGCCRRHSPLLPALLLHVRQQQRAALWLLAERPQPGPVKQQMRATMSSCLRSTDRVFPTGTPVHASMPIFWKECIISAAPGCDRASRTRPGLVRFEREAPPAWRRLAVVESRRARAGSLFLSRGLLGSFSVDKQNEPLRAARAQPAHSCPCR